MKNITKQQIKEAAIEHAKKELGQEQFKNNKDAVNAIVWSYTEGAKYFKQAQED
jgi:hypothetical protein